MDMNGDSQKMKELLEELQRLRRRVDEMKASSVQLQPAETAGVAVQLLQQIIDVLPDHIAVLDTDGTILMVNAAWRRYGDANGLRDPFYGIGKNYFGVCRATPGRDREIALAAEAGIRGVIQRLHDEFALEYPCHGPNQRVWFRLNAGRCEFNGVTWIMVSHTNITKGILAEIELRAVTEHITDTIFLKDREGRYQLLNPAGAALFDLPAEAVLGRTDAEFLDPEISSEIAAIDRQIVESGQPVTYEQTYVIGGIERTLLTSKAPFFSNRGEILGIVGITRDITERKQQEELVRAQKTMLEAVIDASPDIISILGTDGCLQFSSPAVRDVLGYAPETRVGENPLDYMHPEDRERVAQVLHNFMTGRIHESIQRYRYRHADGHWVVLEGHGQAMTDAQGRITGVVIIARDVTEQVRLVEELRAAKEEAQQANAAKNQFLSRMSHELRTPLNAVLGFVQLLKMGELTPEQRESVEYIRRGGEHLLNLINDILDISRIEVGRISLSLGPVPLRETIQETLRLVQRMAAEQSVQLLPLESPGCEGYVLADLQRLKQVLLNLSSNAIKYNRIGGSVAVNCVTPAEGRVQIRITDTGIGIPPEQLQQLFIPFERLDAERRGIQGTGLGLALSRALVEAMGGIIGVESRPDVGTTFWVELPTAEPPEHQSQRVESAPDTSKPENPQPRSRVLYIEDNLSNLTLIERILERRPGIELIAAMQGSIGLDLAQQHRPDLILLDLQLPDMPGEELLFRLKYSPQTENIPVVVISADAIPTHVERVLAAGARAYLTKPLDVKQFLAIIDEFLSRSQE